MNILLHVNGKMFVVLVALLLIVNVKAKEDIKVVKVLDTNLFLLDGNRLVKLANVNTISIKTDDVLKKDFATNVFKFSRKNYENEALLFEFANVTSDSIQLAHMWKKLPFGTESVNATYLRKGFGEYIPEPANRYSKLYLDAATDAARKNKGIYNPENISEPLPKFKNVFWLNGGIGLGFVNPRSSQQVFFINDVNVNYRFSSLVFSGGMQKAFKEVSEINVQYAAMGFSIHDRRSEFVFTFGITRNRFIHNTESEQGTYKSDYYYGPEMKVQMLVHTPVGLGMGFGLDANLSDERPYYMGTLFICLGNWE